MAGFLQGHPPPFPFFSVGGGSLWKPAGGRRLYQPRVRWGCLWLWLQLQTPYNTSWSLYVWGEVCGPAGSPPLLSPLSSQLRSAVGRGFALQSLALSFQHIETIRPSPDCSLPSCRLDGLRTLLSSKPDVPPPLPLQRSVCGGEAGFTHEPEADFVSYCLSTVSISPPFTLGLQSTLISKRNFYQGPNTELLHQSREQPSVPRVLGKPNQRQTLNSSCSRPIKTLLRCRLPLLKSDILV